MIGIEQSALATLFDSLGTELVKLLGKQATEQWKQFGWDKAAAEYGKKMLCLYNTVRVLGKPEPMLLEDLLLTTVYILDKPTAFHRFDISQLRANPDISQLHADSYSLHYKKRQHDLEVVEHYNRLFILGKQGAGKTTFLKYLTLQAIKGKIQKIPVFVSLKEWADSQLELMPFLVQQFEICNFPDAQAFVEHILRRGDALVLFDGLDEVQQDGEQRTQIINVLRNFSKQYLSSQCVITCRIAATDYSFEQFTYVEVADFTDKQKEVFVKNWFRKTPKMAKNFLTEFDPDVHHGLGLPPLLLLSLLCLNYEATQTFPARRMEIYEEAIDALLKKWDSSRQIKRDEGYRKLSLEHKRQLFAKVGYDTFTQNEQSIPQSQLVSKIVEFLQQLPAVDAEDNQNNGEQVLKAIEAHHGIFTERAHRIYSFPHLTFQEHFTAKYIVETPERVQTLTTHLDDDRWREVFLLVASSLDNADHFFACFKQAIDNLVKQDEKLVALLQWAHDKANSVDTHHKIGAVRSFYLFLASGFVLALDLARSLNFFELSRSFNFSALARDLDLALDLDLDLALDLDLSIDYLLNIALQMSLIFRSPLYKGFRDQIPKFKQFFSEVINRCNSLTSLSQALRSLAVPDSQSEQSEWKVFTEELLLIMQRERNIRHKYLIMEQVEMLNTYLQANLLMLEYLKLAAVSDRKAIEDSVLLPPVV
jgi:hypothetical protein